MNKNKFTLSWIKSREYYDDQARSNLLIKFLSINNIKLNTMIDLGGGTGSFMRWCYSRNIYLEKIKVIDNDNNLLKNLPKFFMAHAKKNNYTLMKNNMKSYQIISNKKTHVTKLELQIADIVNNYQEINHYNLISFSAMLDLLTRDFMKKIFSIIKRDKILYFTLCFNGRVKWNSTTKFDKYIINNFNKDQKTNKGNGIALGSDGYKYIKAITLKHGYELHKDDSSWLIKSDTIEKQVFQKRYIKTIYDALKNDDITDKKILRDWKEQRLNLITDKLSQVCVGHDDILIKT